MKKILCCFPKGKYKVLTLSYDDCREADRRLIHIMNRYGIKGTFHINSGMMGQGGRVGKDDIKSLYRGHEVAVHSVTHPAIARCPRELILDEILEDRKALEAIVGYPVRGMSYPYNSYNENIKEMLPYLGIEYSRVVGGSHRFNLPDNLYTWMPTCHHNQDLMKDAKIFTNINQKHQLYMMYVWGHSYEIDNDDNWAMMEEFCELAGGREDTWYATNIQYVDYMKAFRNLEFSANCSFVYNPSVLSVWISVDGDVVEVLGGEQITL